MASAANIVAGQVSAEDVRAFVLTLSSALQPSTCCREQGEIGGVIDHNRDVGILWVVLVRRQRANESNAPDTRTRARAANKMQDLAKQKDPNRRRSFCHSCPHALHSMVPNVQAERPAATGARTKKLRAGGSARAPG